MEGKSHHVQKAEKKGEGGRGRIAEYKLVSLLSQNGQPEKKPEKERENGGRAGWRSPESFPPLFWKFNGVFFMDTKCDFWPEEEEEAVT